MSTTYYRWREPVTKVRVDPGFKPALGGHSVVYIEIGGKDAGALVLPNEYLGAFLGCFEGEPEARTHFGGVKVGTIVTWSGSGNRSGLPAALVQVISDYGEITTMDAVLAQAGQGKTEE